MFDTVLKILLFLSTLAYLPGQSLFIFEQKFFHICVIILTLASFCSPKQREINFNLLIGFNSVFIINTALHGFNSFVMAYTLNIFLFSLTVYLVVSYAYDIKGCIRWILASFVLTTAVLLSQLAGYSLFLAHTGINSGGMMGNLPRLSFLACIVLPFAFDGRFSLITVPVIISSVGIVSPQYCIYAVFLMCLFFYIKGSDDRTFIVIFCIFILCYVAYSKPVSINTRFDYYYPVIRDFISIHWLTGFGSGIPFAPNLGARDVQIYSSILQFVFCTGITGALWLIFALRKFYKTFAISAVSLSLAGLLFISIWEYPFEVKRLWFLIASLIGFLIIEHTEKE